MDLFPSWLIFLLLSTISKSSDVTTCPKTLAVEKGSHYNVTCASGDNINDFYWYKGAAKNRDLVGKLENGETSVSQRYKNGYNITLSGSLEIQNAGLSHESLYTLVTFDLDGVPEEDEVVLNITITPHQACPVIDMCSSCEVCSKSVNRTGSLKCSITESRPKLILKWLNKSPKQIDILKPTLTEARNILSDTWNTSTEIVYFVTSCDQQAVLLCVAQDNMGLLMHKHSSINIYSGNCTADRTDIKDEFPVTTVIVTVVSSSVCLSVAFITCFICFIRRKRKNGYAESKAPGEVELNNSLLKNSAPRKLMTDEARHVISCLKEVYKPHCYYQALPFENPMNTDYLYTGCQCQVTFSDGAKDVVTTDTLLNKDHFKDEGQVIIIGNRGSGKTALLTQTVKSWIDKEDNDFVLIFTSLKGATKDTNLTDLMKQNMSAYNMKDIKYLEETIKDHKCLVLLDGLEEMFTDDGSKSGSVDRGDSKVPCAIEADMPHECLTVGTLLNAGTKKKCSNMKVWVTTRNEDTIKDLEIHQNCKVLLQGFSDKQIQRYIRKTYSSFVHSDRQTASTQYHTSDENMQECANECTPDHHNLSRENPISEDEKTRLLETSDQQENQTCSEDSKNDICESVYKLLEKYDIINDFRKKPFLFCLIARIYVATFVVEIPFAKKTTSWNVASVTDYMINCLMSKFTRECNPGRSQKIITFLEEKALELAFPAGNFHTNSYSITNQDSEEAKDDAIDIGILQERDLALSIDKKIDEISYSQNRDIIFCCRYFQDYFAACGFAKNPQNVRHLSQNLSKYKEEEFSSLVKFFCHLKESFFEEHCDLLLKGRWFNCVVDCLYEVPEGEYEKKNKKICEKEIVIGPFGSHYHKRAITFFFQKCKEKNEKLNSVIFLGEFTPLFLKELCFNSIQKVEFVKKHFTAEEFVYVLKEMKMNHGTKQIRFVMCDLDDLSEKREEIQNMDPQRPAVCRKQNLNDVVFEEFNFKTLQWKLGKMK